MNLFLQYFGIPHGAVWSNVAAEPLIVGASAVVVYGFRHRIGRGLVRWFHKHHTAHMAELAAKERDQHG